MVLETEGGGEWSRERRMGEREEESGVEGGGERGRGRMRNSEREKYEKELEETGVE